MKLDRDTLAAEFAALPRKPEDLGPEEEAEHILELLASGPLADALASYDDPHAIGAGGSNVILDARYEPHQIRRAIKLPRRKITTPAASEKPLPGA